MYIDSTKLESIPRIITSLFQRYSVEEILEGLAAVLKDLVQAHNCSIHKKAIQSIDEESSYCFYISLGRKQFSLVLEWLSPTDAATFSMEDRCILRSLVGMVEDELQRREVGTASSTLLSAREREVAEAICHGVSNRVTAERLGISEATVKRHLYNIYNKIGVTSRTELFYFLSFRGTEG